MVSGPVASWAAAASGPSVADSSVLNGVVVRPSRLPRVSTISISGATAVVSARA